MQIKPIWMKRDKPFKLILITQYTLICHEQNPEKTDKRFNQKITFNLKYHIIKIILIITDMDSLMLSYSIQLPSQLKHIYKLERTSLIFDF